jgi:3-oxoacyl-[acyl-carrier protein] reductase
MGSKSKGAWNNDKVVMESTLPETTSLRGKVALITGSSKSTGAAIAKALAAQGASVVVNYANDSKPAEELVQQINAASIHSAAPSATVSDHSASLDPKFGGSNANINETETSAQRQQQAVVVKADPSTVAGGQYLVQESIRLFGRLDILVLNAGLMGSKTLSEVDEDFFDAHFTANVKAPLFLVKAAVEVMEKPGGRIIFLSTSLTAASSRPPIGIPVL